jgi:Redoxin
VTTATITEQVAHFQQAGAGQMPAEVAEGFAAEQRALAAVGELPDTAQAGTPLPDGDLLDVTGQPTTLTAAFDGKPAVIVFYRGGWCPYCNIALHAYQAQLVPDLADPRHQPRRDQPADTRRVAVHEGSQGADLHRAVRPGQPDRPPPRNPDRASDTARTARLELGLDLTPRSTRTAPPGCLSRLS